MTQIIALTGNPGAGQSTVAGIIGELVPAVRYSLEQAAAAECAQAWGVDGRLFTTRAIRDVSLEQLAMGRCRDPGFRSFAWELGLAPSAKPRVILGRWHTYRRQTDPAFSLYPAIELAATMEQAARVVQPRVLVITDVWYPNEVAWVKHCGGVLWCVTSATRRDPTSPRIGAPALTCMLADQTISNDGSLEELRMRVADLVAGVEVA